jgi:hypothetical protein
MAMIALKWCAPVPGPPRKTSPAHRASAAPSERCGARLRAAVAACLQLGNPKKEKARCVGVAAARVRPCLLLLRWRAAAPARRASPEATSTLQPRCCSLVCSLGHAARVTLAASPPPRARRACRLVSGGERLRVGVFRAATVNTLVLTVRSHAAPIARRAHLAAAVRAACGAARRAARCSRCRYSVAQAAGFAGSAADQRVPSWPKTLMLNAASRPS